MRNGRRKGALTAGRNRRGRARAGLAAGASLLAVAGLALTAGAAQATTFPGTNGLLGYSSPVAGELTNTGSKLEIVTQNSANTEMRCTVNMNTDVNPRFSANGKVIAYLRDGNVWTMNLTATNGECPHNLDGTGGTAASTSQLTTTATDVFLGGWTPANAAGEAWIFFARRLAGPPVNVEIYKIKVDATTGAKIGTGATEVQVTTNAASDSQPAVRADGAKLAWTSNRDGDFDIWTADLDSSANIVAGSEKNERTTGCLLEPKEQSAPSWSPGSGVSQGGTGSNYRLVFQTNRDAASDYEIYRVDDAAGSLTGCGANLTNLTNSGPDPSAPPLLFNATGYDLFPAYSPDGSKICFHSGRSLNHRFSNPPTNYGQWEIYTMNSSDGASVNQETDRAGNDERCGWQKAP